MASGRFCIFLSQPWLSFSSFAGSSFPAKFTALVWLSFFLLIASAMAINKALKIKRKVSGQGYRALMRILSKKMLKMKLKTDNPIPVKARLKELFGDWLFISGYLIALFLLAMGFYYLVLGGIPSFTEAQNQLLAFSSSVLPLTVIFAWLDYRKGSSWQTSGQVYSSFTNIGAFAHSVLRSAIKFFPWQLWHMGAIRSAYQADALVNFLVNFSRNSPPELSC